MLASPHPGTLSSSEAHICSAASKQPRDQASKQAGRLRLSSKQAVKARTSLSELHLVHALACVPVKESLPAAGQQVSLLVANWHSEGSTRRLALAAAVCG